MSRAYCGYNLDEHGNWTWTVKVRWSDGTWSAASTLPAPRGFAEYASRYQHLVMYGGPLPAGI